MTCCVKPYWLGCFAVCQPIATGLLAPVDGNYLVRLAFGPLLLEQTLSLLSGEELVLSAAGLNEHAVYYLTAFDPTCQPLPAPDNCDCLAFRLQATLPLPPH